MSEDEQEEPPKVVEKGIKEMKIKNGDSSDEEAHGTIHVAEVKQSATTSGSNSPHKPIIKSATQSPIKPQKSSQSPNVAKDEDMETVGGEVTVKMEPGQPPKLSRSTSHKIVARSAALFDDYPDKTLEATSTFQVIPECSYSAKYLGSTEHAMDCDCAEEWDATTKLNYACGDDSDCINRATKMECFGDCGCGSDCQNQRFQRRQYAQVAVIKTEKKGYGLRADADLHAHDFIFEYIGEVIHEGQFRRRMHQYDDEGIKHFYFMSLSKGEFVDATKKGNLGRFCNHSCNPNCYVDKWVVGDKLRMGIFAERKIKAGEELVFNYNVDRYGADPQPCYCGEPNCTGFIGGKTQTERATKLSNTTIEALGIDDGDGWDTAVAKKPRKKKAGEEDEEYVNNVQPKSLDEDGVTKVMATLMQCKEKWIAVKLLGRIQRCEDEKVINRVVKMHGYQILNSALSTWKTDFNVALQILDILNHFPRLTRNKIVDSKIEATIESLQGCGDERVESQAAALLKEWSTLEVAYRIPRKKRDPLSLADRHDRLERRDSAREERKSARSRSRSKSRSRSSSRSMDAPLGPSAPTGPRNLPQRNANFYNAVRPPFRPPRPFNPLPAGWYTATSKGNIYYYSATGLTSWIRPTVPAAPPPPPKTVSNNQQKVLDAIINSITSAKANTPNEKVSASTTVQPAVDEAKKDNKSGKEKWRTYSEEKQKKLYENTLFPHIKHVVDKYKTKLPKDDLKRFAKEVAKKLVNSDFKNHRVEDPTRISPRSEKNVKKFVKEYFDKAVAKRRDHEKKKAERKEKNGTSAESPAVAIEAEVKKEDESDLGEGIEMSDDEDIKQEQKSATPITPVDQMTNGDGLKRKRESEEGPNGIKIEDVDATPSKRPRSLTPPAPPPPPPPAEGMPVDLQMSDESPGDDEQLHDATHFVNGTSNGNGGTSLSEEQMEDIDQPPPPPPPPAAAGSIDEQQVDIVVPKTMRGSARFEAPPTPGDLDDMFHDHEEGMEGRNPEAARQVEAQIGT